MTTTIIYFLIVLILQLLLFLFIKRNHNNSLLLVLISLGISISAALSFWNTAILIDELGISPSNFDSLFFGASIILSLINMYTVLKEK
ncbi:hypothetical protein [uncultured Catenibacterium sp.]|uniref:hypothetical protein n=1 Tax=uncultured Catenibacterium sp. TaxID=286142 RepID=UPI0025D161DB|nr:hypothetical protein [uncultured Catenibacterium sp.]